MTLYSEYSEIPLQKSSGFTLIEVLVSLVVISIGLVSALGIQTSAMKKNQSAYLYTQAVIIASDMADRIRVNRTAALDGHYDGLDTRSNKDMSSPSCVSSTGGCTPEQKVDVDAFYWGLNFENLDDTLENYVSIFPEGYGTVETDGNQFTISVFWSETGWGGLSSKKEQQQKQYTLNFLL